MKFKRFLTALLAAVMVMSMVLSGCGGSPSGEETASGMPETAAPDAGGTAETAGDETAAADAGEAGPVEIPGLTYESTLDLEYATRFAVHFYEDGYTVIDVIGDRVYLLVPEGAEAPEGLDRDIIVVQQPLDSIYLAATSAMALFVAANAADTIRFSALEADSWYIDEAAALMESGDIVYAGKYSRPDYELLVNGGCDLAIESTMILHSPSVQEMIEELEIPVFIDRSSYEPEPLGRTEWIKVYGVMTGHLEEAEEFFSRQSDIVSRITEYPEGSPTVAFFNINTSGLAVVRGRDDYISHMITDAGGVYPFTSLENQAGKATISISFEEFYAAARDADYLIYNGTIDTSVTTLADLLGKDAHFEEFRAVQNGNVWIVNNSLYQATDIVSEFILDVNRMLTGGSAEEMIFIRPLV